MPVKELYTRNELSIDKDGRLHLGYIGQDYLDEEIEYLTFQEHSDKDIPFLEAHPSKEEEGSKIDKRNRVSIPRDKRKYSGIVNKVIVFSLKKYVLEIWDKENYKKWCEIVWPKIEKLIYSPSLEDKE